MKPEPSTLIVFEKDGRYLKTINTGYEYERFYIDEENKFHSGKIEVESDSKSKTIMN